MLVWKALKGALPTATRLRERHFDVEPNCKRCGRPESISHLFFQCRFAQEVWALAPLTSGFDPSGEIDFAELWSAVRPRVCLPPSGIASTNLPAWILWGLWTSRNKLVFNAYTFSTTEVLTTALQAAREWQNGQPLISEKQRKINLVPLTVDNAIVVRSDASWKENWKFAGLGWTIAGEAEPMKFSDVEPFVPTPLMAEGIAMREALLKCKEMGVQRVRCEADSKQLISCITNGESVSELYGIASDIVTLASEFEFISFRWISRLQNVLADDLAKQAVVVNEDVNALT